MWDEDYFYRPEKKFCNPGRTLCADPVQARDIGGAAGKPYFFGCTGNEGRFLDKIEEVSNVIL
ncbi:hypothetical protein [Paenibacillus konkukensis]|uniref:hypothetical protein n=1 Tax=Paenibacillus konkukensis TaxID=2020716 RepID=UPI00201D9346|nr:hypothetical protein [Paenibacillus konkukensis]